MPTPGRARRCMPVLVLPVPGPILQRDIGHWVANEILRPARRAELRDFAAVAAECADGLNREGANVSASPTCNPVRGKVSRTIAPHTDQMRGGPAGPNLCRSGGKLSDGCFLGKLAQPRNTGTTKE